MLTPKGLSAGQRLRCDKPGVGHHKALDAVGGGLAVNITWKLRWSRPTQAGDPTRSELPPPKVPSPLVGVAVAGAGHPAAFDDDVVSVYGIAGEEILQAIADAI